MTYNEKFDYNSGEDCYTKMRPLDATIWTNGLDACTEHVDTGEYTTGDLVDGAQYVILRQVPGQQPAPTDERIGRIDPTSAQVVELGTDIAALQTSIDGIDNADVLAVLGTPVTTIAGDIAVVGSSADEIQYVPRASAQVARGESVNWAMTRFAPDDIDVQFLKVA